MVMSQGTYTFLTCFAGFWLIWGLIVLLCCFCSFLRRRLKRRQEERLREQNLRALELEPLELEGSLAGSPPGLAPPPPPHRTARAPAPTPSRTAAPTAAAPRRAAPALELSAPSGIGHV